jgi:hypothetical protein
VRATVVERRAPVDSSPLKLVDRMIPEPREGGVLIRVEVCAIRRTDLHAIKGELPVHRLGSRGIRWSAGSLDRRRAKRDHQLLTLPESIWMNPDLG